MFVYYRRLLKHSSENSDPVARADCPCVPAAVQAVTVESPSQVAAHRVAHVSQYLRDSKLPNDLRSKVMRFYRRQVHAQNPTNGENMQELLCASL
jgi:hypothetical protein